MSDSLEPTTLQDRLERLQELTEFTEKCKKQINDIFEALGWSQDYKNSNREPMEQCPYDPDHMVPVRSMEKHKASCKLRKMGYSAEEQAKMFDPSVCYENTSVRSFIMDKSTQHQVILQARSAAPMMRMEGVFWQGQYSGEPVDVPQNHKRAVCDLTVADRLALYDHVVGALNQQKEALSNNEDLYVDLVSKLQKDEEQNEPKTKLELMAEMRDYKRRRQSYRAKNVHITKKSYTEVIREVISVHSEELARQWREEQDEEESMRSEQSSHGRRADERRSTSSESRHSHSKRHRSRERSHERESKKKKSRKERDSRSPDDHHHHHHDKKKKKKKKKEEKEK
ncbi:U11/U12 small nuclear ribonucleoprotein 48 kDa protein [Archocentrus centrarchus]|uniref:U11/U12 small nuclear ribonucleoprotein 48 kDa protein n=1 Tax=Archocentrus centrarchus TaxID=63155 RepID=UPI0011E9F825|nr:U11/U12 small nuclear ribonucleoprotein 48 kDa protein [Archocentrus centrarchus]